MKFWHRALEQAFVVIPTRNIYAYFLARLLLRVTITFIDCCSHPNEATADESYIRIAFRNKWFARSECLVVMVVTSSRANDLVC